MKSYGAILKEIINSFYEHEYPEYFTDDVSEIIKREGLLKNGDYEAEPVKHGHWIQLGDKSPWTAFHDDAVQCSACKFKYMRLMPRNYCPNCGAKMDEVEE